MNIELTREQLDLTLWAIHQSHGLIEALKVSNVAEELPGLESCRETYVKACELWDPISRGEIEREIRAQLRSEMMGQM